MEQDSTKKNYNNDETSKFVLDRNTDKLYFYSNNFTIFVHQLFEKLVRKKQRNSDKSLRFSDDYFQRIIGSSRNHMVSI